MQTSIENDFIIQIDEKSVQTVKKAYKIWVPFNAPFPLLFLNGRIRINQAPGSRSIIVVRKVCARVQTVHSVVTIFGKGNLNGGIDAHLVVSFLHGLDDSTFGLYQLA